MSTTRGADGLEALFAPASVAVVGASAAPDKAGHQLVRCLLGLPGRLYAVNPAADAILDVPAYPDLRALPEPVDLAVLAVPPRAVPDVLADGAAAGLRAAVVCAGGFAEAGPDGAALQQRIRDVAASAGIRVLGPNTSGFVNPHAGVSATFLPSVRAFRPGGLAVVAQSGGVNLVTCFLAHEAGAGIRLGVGLGNRVDVGFADVLDFLAGDDRTTAIALHVEGVPDGRAFYDAVGAATGTTPVVALVVGRSDVGEVARSHTGAMTGEWDVTRAALRQAGAVVVDDVTELVDAARTLAAGRAAPRHRPGVGVVTGQAGPGLLIVDTLRSAGVAVPQLAPDTVRRVGELLPPLTYQRNPVDTGRPGETFGEVAAAVAGDPSVDALLVYALHEPGAVDLPAAVRRATAEAGVPVVAATGGLPDEVAAVRDALQAVGVPTFDAPERAARAARALAEEARARARRAADDPDGRAGTLAPAGGLTGPVDEDAAKRLLEAIGVPTPRRRVCAGHAEAAAALEELGPPVVVKVLDPAVAHKTDVGGVHVGVRDQAGLDEALAAIDAVPGGADGRRYLVEAMAGPGAELIVGATRSASFGPVVLLGIGGVAVEALGLRVLRLAPLAPADAAEMLAELPGRDLLAGARGRPAADLDALAHVLVRVGDLLVTHATIDTVEINPLRVTAAGAVALDALVTLRNRS